jgi:hypothetical protein
MAWMTGADSEIFEAENDKGDGYGMGTQICFSSLFVAIHC